MTRPSDDANSMQETDDHSPHGEGTYHVNDRPGRVKAHGERLTGREILERVGLSADKYELWTVVDGKASKEIKPDEHHEVKPGDHFRATIRGTDYSTPGSLSHAVPK